MFFSLQDFNFNYHPNRIKAPFSSFQLINLSSKHYTTLLAVLGFNYYYHNLCQSAKSAIVFVHQTTLTYLGSSTGMMMEHKRCPVSLEQNTVMTLTPKRLKAGLSVSSKEKKEKFGERIVALQQLVSPYGKTDTASVLCEALEYIKFLHEQVKVLSAPYLCNSTPATLMLQEEAEEAYRYSLRSKGLLVVPVSYTAGVVSSNGADIWAPATPSSSRF